MARPLIRWENSAQGKGAKPNPYLRRALEQLRAIAPSALRRSAARIADQGCGKLRHFSILRLHFSHITLVDTEIQLSRTQLIGKKATTIQKYIERVDRGRGKYRTVSNTQFRSASLKLDLVFCVCVFDVVPRSIRRVIVKAASSNLKKGGYYCIIVPRNDQSITSRCRPEMVYEDGCLFQRNSVTTFYANFSADSSPLRHLRRSLSKNGFSVVSEFSNYRQLCIICRKTA